MDFGNHATGASASARFDGRQISMHDCAKTFKSFDL
jgi:hypothetical protein